MPPKKNVYRVLNPNNLAPEIRIIAGNYGGREYQWFAGEELEPPLAMSAKQVRWLLERGLIEPKSPPSPAGEE